MRGEVRRFRPDMTDEVRAARLAGWQKALASVLA
jgi:hypothetical protein